MADEKKRAQHFDPMDQMRQKREMQRLELGEAIHNDDHERIAEIDAELAARGEKNITYEHDRARAAFAEFEERQALREQQNQRFEPKTPEREAEQDPQRQPELAQESRQAQSYAELKQEHAGGGARNSPQEPEQAQQPEAGGKRLRFYEDLERDHAKALEKGEKREESKEQGQGEKKLAFFEDRDPSQNHGLEH
jgi:hypothetical protein